MTEHHMSEAEAARYKEITQQEPQRMETVVEWRVTEDTVFPPLPEHEYWLGYTVQEGEKFRLVPIGSEAEIDALLEEYKATAKIQLPIRMALPLHLTFVPYPVDKVYEEVQVLLAVKLKASEVLRATPHYVTRPAPKQVCPSCGCTIFTDAPNGKPMVMCTGCYLVMDKHTTK